MVTKIRNEKGWQLNLLSFILFFFTEKLEFTPPLITSHEVKEFVEGW